MEQFILSEFLLNLAGCCNILINRNFAAEIVGRMQESQLFLSSIAIRNAPDDIQVFNDIFVTQFCHLWDFQARSVQFQVLLNIYSVQRSREVMLAEWERSAVVTVWIRIRILVGSLNGYRFLLLLVA